MLGPVQGPSGCAQMLWRNSLDGYLRQILNARVYDVAVRLQLTVFFARLVQHNQSSLPLFCIMSELT